MSRNPSGAPTTIVSLDACPTAAGTAGGPARADAVASPQGQVATDVPQDATQRDPESRGNPRQARAKRSKAEEAAGQVIDALSEAAKKRLAEEGQQQ